jgi:branched-chain amino acid transport system permease protein
MIEDIIVYGAIAGAIYSLLALGFTLIYGVAGVTNLAHGALFMVGAYIFGSFGPLGVTELDPRLGLVISLVLTAIIGAILYRIVIHPIIEDELAILVVTVSVAIIFQQLMLLIFGSSFLPVANFATGSTIILGVQVTYSRLVAFVVSIALFLALWIFISKTKIGSAMRAVSQDREVAMLMGVNTTRLYMLTMGISAMLAGAAGIFEASSSTGVASAYMWLHPLALSFSIVILGGLGSVKGTIVGGFIIGYTETIVSVTLPEAGILVPTVPFVLMVLILVIRPKGLFGKRIELED